MKFDAAKRPEVNNPVSHNLAIDVRKGVHTVRHKGHRYLASAPHYFSRRLSARYKYFNEQVQREWGKGTELETTECGLYIGTHCSPISRHLARFPPFSREAGPCHARPPACVGIIVAALLRRPPRFPTPSWLGGVMHA